MGFLKWSGGFEGLERRRGWNGFDPLRDRRAETSRNLAGGALSGTGKSGGNGRSAESQFAQAIGSQELVARIPRRSPDWNKRDGRLGEAWTGLLHECRAQGHAQSSGEPESNDAAACRGLLALQLAKRSQMKHWMGNIEPIDVTRPEYKESSRLPSYPTRIQSWRGAEFKENSGPLRQKRSGGGAGAIDRKINLRGPPETVNPVRNWSLSNG